MAQGGARPGGGRPKGAVQKITTRAREAAAETGLLPHEWLLKVSRGEPIEQKRWKVTYDKLGNEKSRILVTEEYYADFCTRVDAAKAAAPFYAPKLAAQTVTMAPVTLGVHNLSDDELNSKLSLLMDEVAASSAPKKSS